jgi:predicted RNA-binding protein associated with RNAse of E/G family
MLRGCALSAKLAWENEVMRGSPPRPIRIVYKRLPNDIREIPGVLRAATSHRLIIESPIVVSHPIREASRIIAENGYLAIWFVYRNRWYDIGKFFDRARKCVGYYCDIIKPIEQLQRGPSKTVMITDLFLDLWIWPNGRYTVLDRDEFKDGLRRGHISKALACEARGQLDLLVKRLKSKRFPPEHVRRVIPLEKAA